jgi:hypothetical protein
MKKTILIVTILSFGIFGSLKNANAKSKFGVRAGSYTDLEELFLGVDLLSPIGSHTYLNPNLEYVFIDYGTYLTANMDFHYDFDTRSPFFFWLGGGAGLAYFSPEGGGDSNSELALNILGGLGLKTRGSLVPYIQAKAILGDADDFVITLGLRF